LRRLEDEEQLGIKSQVASVKITAWRAPHGPKPTFCTVSVVSEEVYWGYSAETNLRRVFEVPDGVTIHPGAWRAP